MKAEAAKCVFCIPDAGPRAQEFGPSSAQKNVRQKKSGLPESVRIAMKSTLHKNWQRERCEGTVYGRLREHSGETN